MDGGAHCNVPGSGHGAYNWLAGAGKKKFEGPVEHMVSEFVLTYKGAKDKQVPEFFETGPKDTLSIILLKGPEPPATEGASLASTVLDRKRRTTRGQSEVEVGRVQRYAGRSVSCPT